MKAFMEVGPLFEEQWTGIPNVNRHLAFYALKDQMIEWSFFYENLRVPRDVVEKFLRSGTGRGGLRTLERLAIDGEYLEPSDYDGAGGLFLNVKGSEQRFTREALFLHDLSTLLVPQFHSQATVEHHLFKMKADLRSSDVVFHNSYNTYHDCKLYFPNCGGRHVIVPMGLDMDLALLYSAYARSKFSQIDPYLLVLGVHPV